MNAVSPWCDCARSPERASQLFTTVKGQHSYPKDTESPHNTSSYTKANNENGFTIKNIKPLYFSFSSMLMMLICWAIV